MRLTRRDARFGVFLRRTGLPAELVADGGEHQCVGQAPGVADGASERERFAAPEPGPLGVPEEPQGPRRMTPAVESGITAVERRRHGTVPQVVQGNRSLKVLASGHELAEQVQRVADREVRSVTRRS